MISNLLNKLPFRKDVIPEALGIHVGREAVTIVRVAKLPGRIEIKAVYSEPMSRLPGVWPADVVAETLRAARKSVDLRAPDARITLASDLAPTHFLVLPPMKGEQLRDAIKLQLQNEGGDNAADLSYQVQVLEKRRERCRILVPSIPTERLRSILGSFLETNCHLDSMEVEGVSFANLLAHAQVSDNAPVAVLLIGSNWGEIFIFRRNKIVLSRPISKLEADSGSAAEAGVTHSGADDIPDLGDTDGPLDPTTLGHLVREANKTLDYYEIELLSPAVERLYVAGEAADTPELLRFLGEQLELHAVALDSGERVEDTTGEYEPTRHGLAVAAAIGGSAE